MMCKLVTLKVNDYLDRRLPDREREALDLHLASCENCRQLVETMRLVTTTLQDLPQYAVDDRFASRLMGRLPQSVSVWQAVSDVWSQWVLSPGNRLAAAGLGIAVAVALIITPQLLHKPAVKLSVDRGRSSFVMQCVEQHAAFTGDQTMPETLSLDRAEDSAQAGNF